MAPKKAVQDPFAITLFAHQIKSQGGEFQPIFSYPSLANLLLPKPFRPMEKENESPTY